MNTWPTGKRHAMSQCDHNSWNASNYPGTLQICYECDEPTGNCEDDSNYSPDGDALCWDCYLETMGDSEREELQERV